MALEHLFVQLREGAGADVKVVGSASASNEALAALAAVAGAAGDVTARVFRSPRAADEVPLPGFPLLVRRRDLAPNVDGAGLLGLRALWG